MYNCWNEAYNYLANKYGKTFLRYTYKFDNCLSYKTLKQIKELKTNATDSDKIFKINEIGEEDRVIERLMEQYYYGIQAKKELYELLINLGVINLSLSK